MQVINDEDVVPGTGDIPLKMIISGISYESCNKKKIGLFQGDSVQEHKRSLKSQMMQLDRERTKLKSRGSNS